METTCWTLCMRARSCADGEWAWDDPFLLPDRMGTLPSEGCGVWSPGAPGYRYGAEGKVLPRNGRPAGQKEEQQAEGAAEEEDAGVPRDTVVVLDADGNAMAEQVVLQLILKRAKVRVVVRDVGAAKQAFGPYVEAVPGDSSDAALLLRTLRGAKAAVACGPLGKLLPAAAAARLPRLVLLSSVGAVGPSGFAALPFSAAAREAAVLGDASREAEVAGAASLRHTIVQVAVLTDSPGASSELRLTAGGKAGGAISREDAARVLAEAAEWEGNPSFVLQAAAGVPGEPPTDWSAVFDALQPVPAA